VPPLHPYLPQTEAQINAMLEEIGVSSIDELFSGIPENLFLSKKIDIPSSHSEQETITHIREILSRNKPIDSIPSFIGAGIYHHFIPAVVSTLISRSEFYTSYTPYAPELSQGMLQALWEYQSMIAELTGLDLVNSSMYDMATALGEAALMCTRVTKKEIFLVPSYLQPERFQTLQTYAQGPQISIKTYPFDKETGTLDLNALINLVNSYRNQISGIYVENPNFWGNIEPNIQEIEKTTHEVEALFVVGIQPISLGILKSPGDYGADIAIGEGQSIGLPMNFGGPLLGIFAVQNDKKLTRAMPGRIIGISTELKSSKRAFTMTLQTREQHIRREKAISNICTNQSLCSIAALIYLVSLGKTGLREIAIQNVQKANYVKKKLGEIKGFKILNQKPTYNEFLVRCPNIDGFTNLCKEANLLPPLKLSRYFPNMKDIALVCVTEMNTNSDIEAFLKAASLSV